MNTMSITKSTTIDRAGRLVVPKAIRDAAGLEPGTRLTVRLRGTRVELEPEPPGVRLERRGGILVAVHDRDAEPLTEDQVRETLERVRNREA